MYVVIFRAKTKTEDEAMSKMAERLREMALEQFGCLEFVGMAEDNEELAVSYWPDEDSIRAWKQQADHVVAQELGRTQWYDWYSVEVTEVKRSYKFQKEA
jgi:heme-degrading monooxygenase HmoA